MDFLNFPENLYLWRKRAGWSQAQLAKFLEVSPRAIWTWENGRLPHILTQEAVLARLEKAKA